MNVFLLTPLLATEELCNPNVLKVIPIQVTVIQCLSHERRLAKGTRDCWDPSLPFWNYFA